MELFLVTGEVEKSNYLGDSSKSIITRLVEAFDNEDAELKFKNHYENKTKEYDVYYYVWNVESSSIIK
jgi:hypothetical protein